MEVDVLLHLGKVLRRAWLGCQPLGLQRKNSCFADAGVDGFDSIPELRGCENSVLLNQVFTIGILKGRKGNQEERSWGMKMMRSLGSLGSSSAIRAISI